MAGPLPDRDPQPEARSRPTLRPLPPSSNPGHTTRGRDSDAAEDSESTTRFTVPPAGGHTTDPGATVKPLPATVRIFPYGVSRSRLDRAVAETRVPAQIARDVGDADVVVALKATYKREPGKMREAAQRRLPVYVVKSNTYAQIAGSIREIFRLGPATEEPEDTTEDSLLEAQEGIDIVKQSGEAVDLAPANSYTRRLQHQLIERYQLVSESVGVEPNRRVRILPVGA